MNVKVKAATYTMKPIDVEAYRWDGSLSEMHFLVGWLVAYGHSAWIQNNALSNEPELVRVDGTVGVMTVKADQWVVIDNYNVVHILTDEVFNATYAFKELKK